MTEKLQDMENEAMCKIVELEKQLMQRNKDLESMRVRLTEHLVPKQRVCCVTRVLRHGNGRSLIQEVYKDTSSQVHSLRHMLKEKDEAILRQSKLEKKIHELEKQGTIKIHKKGDGDISILPSPPSGVEGFQGSVLGGGGGMVDPNFVGGVAGLPAPPPPPPLPVNGTRMFDFACDPSCHAERSENRGDDLHTLRSLPSLLRQCQMARAQPFLQQQHLLLLHRHRLLLLHLLLQVQPQRCQHLRLRHLLQGPPQCPAVGHPLS